MKIFITGCARSGTTLVRRLFNAFDLKVCNSTEIKLEDFIASDYNVGKRVFETIYSAELTEDELQRQYLGILENEIQVINVVRNWEDVLKSSNGYVTSERYHACMVQRVLYKYAIGFEIPYESLISDPDEWQRAISDMYKLKQLHKWSAYPDFMKIEEEDPLHRDGVYAFRKIRKTIT